MYIPREFAHPTFSCQSSGWLFQPQHLDLLPAVRVRLQNLGVHGSQRMDVPYLYASAQQAPQHGATGPRPTPQSVVQRLGRILQHGDGHSRGSRLQQTNLQHRVTQGVCRVFLRLLQPGRRTTFVRQRGVHPPHPPRRGESAQPQDPHQRLGLSDQCQWW